MKQSGNALATDEKYADETAQDISVLSKFPCRHKEPWW